VMSRSRSLCVSTPCWSDDSADATDRKSRDMGAPSFEWEHACANSGARIALNDKTIIFFVGRSWRRRGNQLAAKSVSRN
jgi:hypothetical protein